MMTGMIAEHGDEIIALRAALTHLQKEVKSMDVGERYKSTDAERDFRLRDYRIEICEEFIREHRKSMNGNGHKKQ